MGRLLPSTKSSQVLPSHIHKQVQTIISFFENMSNVRALVVINNFSNVINDNPKEVGRGSRESFLTRTSEAPISLATKRPWRMVTSSTCMLVVTLMKPKKFISHFPISSLINPLISTLPRYGLGWAEPYIIHG